MSLPVVEMSATEALRTQLDAVNTQRYLLEAENRRLREEQPERAEMIHVEEELRQTREENVSLSQRISELSRDRAQADGDEASGTPGPEDGQLREKLASLEEEAATLRHRVFPRKFK